MANVFGLVDIATPEWNISGLLSSSWIYVFIIGFLGFIAISVLVLVLFLRTFNRKVIFFENVSGMGYQPTMRKRARVIQVGSGGEERLKLLGGRVMTAYGRKMGSNTYWFAKGLDGYWYNFLMGDLDTKMAILDIEPVDKDVRAFHTAQSKINMDSYNKPKQWGLIAMGIGLFIFFIIFLIGLYVIVGKIADVSAKLGEASTLNAKTQAAISQDLVAYSNIVTAGTKTSGIISVNGTGG